MNYLKLLCLISCLFIGNLYLLGSTTIPIVTKWNTNNTGKLTLFIQSGATYDYEYHKVGETTKTTGSATGTIDLALEDGEYIISFKPTFRTFKFLAPKDELQPTYAELVIRKKLLDIESWGDYVWPNYLSGMFSGAENLEVSAIDQPVFSDYTNLGAFFFNNKKANLNVSHWDVSKVTIMSYIFGGTDLFNQSLSTWDVSNVVDMSNMFYKAKAFNKSLNAWNVSGVLNMCGMFSEATTFNQTLNTWDVSEVTNMNSMFSGAILFNQPLSNWDVSKVKDMSHLFSGATSFDLPLSSWNVGNVVNMNNMFHGASLFNQPLNAWDVSRVENMSSMFYNAKKFNQTLNNWNVSNVKDMRNMFTYAAAFNGSVNDWDVSKVIDMDGIFFEANSFNQPFDQWNFNPLLAMQAILFNTKLDCINYGKLLQKWVSITGLDDVNLSNVYPIKYGAFAKPYRDQLIARGWQIFGDTFDASCDATLGVDVVIKEEFSIYPNPATDVVKINIKKQTKAELYNMSGKYIETIDLKTGENTVDVRDLSSGIYLLKTETTAHKIIKK